MNFELSNKQEHFWQWDTGQSIILPIGIPTVHFKWGGQSIKVTPSDGVCPIPDELLQGTDDLIFYTYNKDHTIDGASIKIYARTKPADYVYTPTEIKTWEQLDERIKALEQGGGIAGVSSVNGQTGAVEITAKGLGALTEDDLQSATNAALAQAKASGEFDGAPGAEGPQGPQGPAGPPATDAQVSDAVSAWLAEHPETTTTVQDGAITAEKVADMSITPKKTSFIKTQRDQYLWSLDDFNMRAVARTRADPESSDCIYAGWYSDFKECSDSKIVSIFHGETSETTHYLKLITLCYDSEKNYLGSAGNWSGATLKSNDLIIKVNVLKEGTNFVRFYHTEEVESARFYKEAKFYAAVVNDTALAWDRNVAESIIDGYNMLPIGVTNMLKNIPIDPSRFNNMDPFDFYIGTQKTQPVTIYPMQVDDCYVYSLIKIGTESDAWKINLHQRLSCFDANGNHLGSIGSLQGDNSTDVNVEYLYGDNTTSYAKFTLLDGTKYITWFGNSIYVKFSDIKQMIISEQEIPLDSEADTYYAVKSKMLDDYAYARAQKVVDDNMYHRFTKIGKIVPSCASAQYQCWGHNMLHYDKTKNTFVCALRGSTTHGGVTAPTMLSIIDAESLSASQQLNITVPDLETAIWCCGFWINSSGEYVMLGLENDNVYRLKSADYGTTWTNTGEITVTDGESKKFFSVYRLSSGRLLGAYDDTVVPTSQSKITKIGLSDDDGMSWQVLTLECEYSTVEQSYVEIGDAVMMLGRKNSYGSTRNPVYIAYSMDNGSSWSKIVASKTLYAHSSDTCAYMHDGIVEVLGITRFYNNVSWGVPGKVGQITHFSATTEQALNDQFYTREIFYADGNASADFTSPSCAVDSNGNVLVAYADSQKGNSLPTEWHFLYSGNKPVVCDGRATNLLPYSGKTTQDLFDSLVKRIEKVEQMLDAN